MGIVSLIADFVGTNTVLLASAIICTGVIIVGFIFSAAKGLLGSDYAESAQNGSKQIPSAESGSAAIASFGESDSTVEIK